MDADYKTSDVNIHSIFLANIVCLPECHHFDGWRLANGQLSRHCFVRVVNGKPLQVPRHHTFAAALRGSGVHTFRRTCLGSTAWPAVHDGRVFRMPS